MRYLLKLLPLTIVMAAVTAAASPSCSLPESVLQPFVNGPSQIRRSDLRVAEKAFNRFDVCVRKTGQIDEPSRTVLFKLVDATFSVDYLPLYKKWKDTEKSGQSEDGPGVGDFQHDLLDLLDRSVDASYLPYRDMILKYASGKAIADLGPAVSADVRRMAGTAPAVTGVGNFRISHAEAFKAIGYWIDPENSQFSEQDKEAMTEFLLGALTPNPEYLSSDLGYRINLAALQALAHSSDATVPVRVRKWAATPSPDQNLLRAEAEHTAVAVEKRLLK